MFTSFFVLFRNFSKKFLSISIGYSEKICNIVKPLRISGGFLLHYIGAYCKTLNYYTMNEPKKYIGLKRVAKRYFEHHAEMIEKDVIIKFLRDLPIEELKKLISFECFDAENMKKPDVAFDSMEELENYLALRNELYFNSEVEFRCEILIP